MKIYLVYHAYESADHFRAFKQKHDAEKYIEEDGEEASYLMIEELEIIE